MQVERDRQYLRSASRKKQTVSTQCKQKETGSIYEVQAIDRQYLRRASSKRQTVSTQCTQKETDSIYAMQAEEIDIFYAVRRIEMF